MIKIYYLLDKAIFILPPEPPPPLPDPFPPLTDIGIEKQANAFFKSVSYEKHTNITNKYICMLI
jgi:hypothetical protein